MSLSCFLNTASAVWDGAVGRENYKWLGTVFKASSRERLMHTFWKANKIFQHVELWPLHLKILYASVNPAMKLSAINIPYQHARSWNTYVCEILMKNYYNPLLWVSSSDISGTYLAKETWAGLGWIKGAALFYAFVPMLICVGLQHIPSSWTYFLIVPWTPDELCYKPVYQRLQLDLLAHATARRYTKAEDQFLRFIWNY